MSLEVVLTRGLTRGVMRYKHSQVLLLSQYQKDDVNYPIITILPDYHPDLALGTRIKARNLIHIKHGILPAPGVEEENYGAVLVKAAIEDGTKDPQQEDLVFLLNVGEYDKFIQFAPKLFSNKVKLTPEDPGSDCWERSRHSNILSEPPPTSDEAAHSDFLSPYMKFLGRKNCSLELMSYSLTPEETLGFVASLGWTEELVFQSLLNFLLKKKCKNLFCPRFTDLKCEGCRLYHYCGQACQKKAHSKHKLECSDLQLVKLKNIHYGVFLEEQFKQRLKVKEVPSFELFLQQVNAAIFEVFKESFEVPAFKSLVVKHIGKDKKYWGDYLDHLKIFSTGSGLQLTDLIAEMDYIWGKKNFLAQAINEKEDKEDNAENKCEKNGKVKGKKIHVSKFGNMRKM